MPSCARTSALRAWLRACRQRRLPAPQEAHLAPQPDPAEREGRAARMDSRGPKPGSSARGPCSPFGHGARAVASYGAPARDIVAMVTMRSFFVWAALASIGCGVGEVAVVLGRLAQ